MLAPLRLFLRCRPPRFSGCLFALASLLLGAGCATTTEKSDIVRLFWPGPPEVARIKFLTMMASETDLGRDTTFNESLLTFLTGHRPPIWRLYNPLAVAVSDDGQRVYVSDYSQAMVYVFDLAEKKVRLIGDTVKLFDRPVGIALDGKENLYVVDTVGKSVIVLDREGRLARRIVGGDLERPTGIAIDRTRGRVYVADTSHQRSTNHFVRVFDLEGKALGKIGKGKGNAEGALLFPTYLAVDREGNLYVSDTMNARVQVFSPDGRSLRTIGERGDAPGTFSRPKGVALDSFGNLYVVDSDWANVQIFNGRGQALLFFGGRGRYPGHLNSPTGIAIDKENKIYVADTQNFRVSVYQLVNTKPEDSFLDPNAHAKKGGGSGSEVRGPAGQPPQPRN